MNARIGLLATGLLLSACSAAGSNGGGDGAMQMGQDGNMSTPDGDAATGVDVQYNHDIQAIDIQLVDNTPPPDVFFAMDPPPMMCWPDGGVTTDAASPGGTVMCPSDKNLPGCPCPTLGMSAACWTGYRAERGHGICMDGTTTCVALDDVSNAWGPCNGEVLPNPGATTGADACGCFSSGTWALANLSPCVIGPDTSGNYYLTSSVQTSGDPTCGDPMSPPFPAPAANWSTDTLQADCAGTFTLCYTIKAGNVMSPSASDCTVGQACIPNVWYPTSGAMQTLPPLPGWGSSMDPGGHCATSFYNSGGYGEMSVQGRSAACETVDDGMGHPFVFQRVGYCSSACAMDPSGPGCAGCSSGGSGMF